MDHENREILGRFEEPPDGSAAFVLRCRDIVIRRMVWTRPARWAWLGTAGTLSAAYGLSEPVGLVFPENAGVLLGREAGSASSAPFFLQSGRPERVAWDGAGSCLVLWAERSTLQGVGENLADLPRQVAETVLTRSLRGLLTAAADALRTGPAPTPAAQYALERLLLDGARGMIVEADATAARKRGEGVYERTLALIRVKASDQEYSVAALAADLGLSERHLQRAFAEHDRSPRGTLRRARVDLALEMLRDPDADRLTLDEIALRSGFADATAMRACFVRESLDTPRRLRRDRARSRLVGADRSGADAA